MPRTPPTRIHTMALKDGTVVTTTWHATVKEANARVNAASGATFRVVQQDSGIGGYRGVTWTPPVEVPADADCRRRNEEHKELLRLEYEALKARRSKVTVVLAANETVH